MGRRGVDELELALKIAERLGLNDRNLQDTWLRGSPPTSAAWRPRPLRPWEAWPVLDPLVVTLVVDEATQAQWDEMRRRWFPPERLVVGAHVTLFHALPGDRLDAVEADLEDVALDVSPFPLAIIAVRPLGRGVALRVESAALDRLHADLATRWRTWLTKQDGQRFDAHVTIQNKVSPEEARAALAQISSGFLPSTAVATGLALWRYVGGPWEALGTSTFQASPHLGSARPVDHG